MDGDETGVLSTASSTQGLTLIPTLTDPPQAQQNKFLEGQMDVEEDEEEDDREEGKAESLESGAPKCLFCHERTGSPLGYVGLAQRSTALANAVASLDEHTRLRQRSASMAHPGMDQKCR